MAGSERLYCSLLLIGVVTVVCGNEDMRDAINQVSQLQADLLWTIVPSFIHNQVEQAMGRILGDQSIYNRVRHLKHNLQRHIHSMERRLKTLEDDRDEKKKTIERLQEEYQQCEVRMQDLQRDVNSSQLHVSNVYSELKQEVNSTQFKLNDIEDNFSKKMNNVTLLTEVVNNSMERRLKTLEEDRDEKTGTIERLQGEHQQCEVRMEDLEREVNTSQLHVSNVYSELKQEVNSTQFKLDDMEDNFSIIMNNLTLLAKVVNNSMERRLKTLEDDRDEKTRTIERLQEEHQQCEVRMTDLQRDVNSSQLHVSNVYSELKQEVNSTQFKLDDIEDNFTKIMNNITLLKKVVDKMDNITKYLSCITSRPAKEMNRIIVIQRHSFTVQYPHQIDLHSNEMSSYTYLHTSRTISSTYDPISRRIIFSRKYPAGVYSSRLDVDGIETLKHKVTSWGMAVDADRGIVFLTTEHPRKTISRMTTTGNDFRGVVDLTGKLSYRPEGIAIDGRQRVIYFCAWDRLLSVDYDGESLRTLHRGGSDIDTVIFDDSKGSIFFNVGKKVMMKSMPTNRTTEIMELGYTIWKFVLYNNSLFVSSWNERNIGVIHLERNTYSNLKNMEHTDNDIILVP